jgi:predicted enzyme related to lactoylglutathione lyase
MIELRVCIDVDDMEKAIAFYTAAIGLTIGRRFDANWVELVGASAPLDLRANPTGSEACACDPSLHRDYQRHWTPVHLDFVVSDLEEAVERVRALGGTLDREIQDRDWGRMANLADPFGNGFCLLEFRGEGYGALAEAADAGVTTALL